MNTLTRQQTVSLDPPKGPVIVISPENHEERDDALVLASVIKAIESPAQMIAASEVLGRLDKIARSVEKEGEKVRAPFTKFAKQIIGVVNAFLPDVNKERARLGRLIADRASEERKAAAELEAQKAREKAEKEAAWQAEIAAMDRAQMKADDAEFERLEEQMRIKQLEIDRLNRATAEPVAPASIPGLVVKEAQWKFRVVDVNKLPPEFVVRAANEIALQVAVDQGVREITGCEIWLEQPKAFTRTPTTYAKGSE